MCEPVPPGCNSLCYQDLPLTSNVGGVFHCCGDANCKYGSVSVDSDLRWKSTNLRQLDPEYTFPFATPYVARGYKFEERVPIDSKDIRAQGDLRGRKACDSVTGVPYTRWGLSIL